MEKVGGVEEIEEISRVPPLAEDIPFVGEAFRAGLVAPDDEDGDPDLEFIYDTEEMVIGEQRVQVCIQTFQVWI